MNSSLINISEILKNAKTLLSAGFSCSYNFDNYAACEYFDDLINNSSQNFAGVLAVENVDGNITIVDGLQRITTICLLLCALCENYKNTSQQNEDARNKILQRFLLDEKNSPKLKLIGADNNIYRKILFSESLDENEMYSSLVKTYNCFLDKIKQKEISGTSLYRKISKIKFMLIVSSSSDISNGDLYWSLNSNKEDSQINLITDFLLKKGMLGWQQVLEYYSDLGFSHLLKKFVRDFLVVQMNGRVPAKDKLYENFKNYYAQISHYLDKNTIEEHILKYSKYYIKIFNADFEHSEIKTQIETLNQNDGQDAYPYLIEVLDDLDSGNINEEIFVEILNMVNAFVLKRRENPLEEVSLDFASLSRELNKMLILDDYIPEIDDNKKITINEINKLSTFEV